MGGIYVDGIEICEIPIGKDDARGSPVWVFHREWAVREKKWPKWLKSLVEKSRKTSNLARIWSRKIEIEF